MSYVLDMKEGRLQNGNLVAVNTKAVHAEFGTILNETVIIFEFIPTKSSKESSSGSWLDLSNFKMPA